MSLKKIVKEPQEAPPQLMRQASSPEVKSVPEKSLYNSNLKKVKGFHNLRSNLKREIFLDEFISESKSALELYSNDDATNYDNEILLCLMQTAEDTFIQYKKQGVEKKHAVVEICKKYYDDNDVLVGKLVEQNMKNIKHSNFLRRNKNRLIKIFFLFVNIFLRAPNRR